MKKIISLLTALSLMFGVFGMFTVFAEETTDITELNNEQRVGTIAGKTTKGASLTLLKDSNTITSTISDENGNFVFENVPEGTGYEIIGFKYNYVVNGERDITVEAGKTTTVNIFLPYGDNVPALHKHKICSDTVCEDNHEVIKWTAWGSATSLPTGSGNYYLTKDVEISTPWNPADGTALCLNGHSIRQSVRQSVINPRGTFSLCDCAGDGTVTGGALGVSLMGEGQVFNMYGGKITGNHFEGGVFEGGGVVCLWGSTFNMYGGEISSNSSDSVGGVKMYGQMSIGGKAVIKDNTDAGGGTANLFLSSNNAITNVITVASPLTEGAYIGIAYYPALMTKIPKPITGSNNADYSKYFHSDNETYKIINDENNALQFVFKNNSYPYYDIKEVFAVDAEDNRLDAIPANTEFTAYGFIEQIAGLEGTDYGTVVIAAYDEQGALIDVGMKDITNLEYFPCSYTADLKSGEKPVSSIKVFVWDMLHAMQPLAAANSQTFTEE